MVQVKSKKRVAEHGEVFTAEREVNAMLDMVKQETERIDSRFLEPACGNGNFLIEIIKRKMEVVKSRYGRNQYDFERYMMLAVSSIYGVELLEDNVAECRKRLYDFVYKTYKAKYRTKVSNEVCLTIEFLLKKNIVAGDALTMLQNNGEPIVFSEWSLVNGGMFKRRDYTLNELLTKQQFGEPDSIASEWLREQAIPKTIAEFPVTQYTRLKDYD